jgi:DNA-binding NarL/FixJ family response regulator
MFAWRTSCYTGKHVESGRHRVSATVHRVFIVGDSLFAEAVAQLLGHSAVVEVVGTSADVHDALAQLPICRPDVLMVLSRTEDDRQGLYLLLAADPDLPIIRSDLDFDGFRIIHSRQVGTRTTDLLATILALPIRR